MDRCNALQTGAQTASPDPCWVPEAGLSSPRASIGPSTRSRSCTSSQQKNFRERMASSPYQFSKQSGKHRRASQPFAPLYAPPCTSRQACRPSTSQAHTQLPEARRRKDYFADLLPPLDRGAGIRKKPKIIRPYAQRRPSSPHLISSELLGDSVFIIRVNNGIVRVFTDQIRAVADIDRRL